MDQCVLCNHRIWRKVRSISCLLHRQFFIWNMPLHSQVFALQSKKYSSPKKNLCCHHILTLVSLQTSMTYILSWRTRSFLCNESKQSSGLVQKDNKMDNIKFSEVRPWIKLNSVFTFAFIKARKLHMCLFIFSTKLNAHFWIFYAQMRFMVILWSYGAYETWPK